MLLSVEDNDKEDISRKHVMTLIDLFIQKSIEQLISIQQELELLNQMQEIREQSGPGPLIGTPNDNRVETISRDTGPLLSKDGKVIFIHSHNLRIQKWINLYFPYSHFDHLLSRIAKPFENKS